MPEAERHVEAFKALLPAVRIWMDAVVAAASEDEWVATHGGRRRYFRNLKSRKRGVAPLLFIPNLPGREVSPPHSSSPTTVRPQHVLLLICRQDGRGRDPCLRWQGGGSSWQHDA